MAEPTASAAAEGWRDGVFAVGLGWVLAFGRRGSIISGSVSSSLHDMRGGRTAAAGELAPAAARAGRSSKTTPNPPMRSLIRLWRTLSSTVTPDPTRTRRVPPMSDARSNSPPLKLKSFDATRSPTKLSTLPRRPVTDAAAHRVMAATSKTR
jgi:hypothetical protein